MLQEIDARVRPQAPKQHSSLVLGASHQRAISVLTDEQEKNVFEQRTEIARNLQILKKAQLSNSSFELVKAILQTKIPGTFQHKQKEVMKEIIEYFKNEIYMDIRTDYFCPKIQANYDNPSTETLKMAIMLYGVDFMQTQNIGEKLCLIGTDQPQYHIQELKWMDDSNCLVVFDSPQSLETIIKNLILNIEQFKFKVEDNGRTEIPTKWFELKPYEVFGFQRRWFFRYATFPELSIGKSAEANEVSLYINFENAKKNIQNDLLKKFNAKSDYDKFLEQKQFEKVRNRFFSKPRYTHLLRTVGDIPKFQNYISNQPEKTINQKKNQQNSHPNTIQGNTAMEIEEASKPAEKQIKVMVEDDMVDESEQQALIEKINNRAPPKNSSALINQDIVNFISNQPQTQTKVLKHTTVNSKVMQPTPESIEPEPEPQQPQFIQPVPKTAPTVTKSAPVSVPVPIPPTLAPVAVKPTPPSTSTPVARPTPAPIAPVSKPASKPVAKPAPKPAPKPSVAYNDDSY